MITLYEQKVTLLEVTSRVCTRNALHGEPVPIAPYYLCISYRRVKVLIIYLHTPGSSVCFYQTK